MYKMAIAGKQKASVEEVEEQKAEEKQKAKSEIKVASPKEVHQIIRSISLTGQFTQEGAQPASVIDAYLSEYLNSGYELVATHHLGTRNFEGTPQPIAEVMLYVMVRK
jgi:hypothetical protein